MIENIGFVNKKSLRYVYVTLFKVEDILGDTFSFKQMCLNNIQKLFFLASTVLYNSFYVDNKPKEKRKDNKSRKYSKEVL